jgi:curli biogenesis system outer membrane secretion channel CsgG
VLVVGELGDPSRAPFYAYGVGRMMSDALARAMLNDGTFDVWIDARLTGEVERILAGPSAQQDAGLGDLSRRHPDVRYVITGKVTDFQHTGDLPEAVSRRGILGPRNEAVAALDFRIVDLRTRRVIGADHIKATACARNVSADETYSAVALDSYVFWSTPLGRASKQVVERAVERTARLVPLDPLEARIERLTSRRRVTITGGRRAGLIEGRKYHLVTAGGGAGMHIRDAVTGRPLIVHIESASARSATGLLLGEPSVEVELRGAVLRAAAPPAPSPQQEPAPAVTAATDEP